MVRHRRQPTPVASRNAGAAAAPALLLCRRSLIYPSDSCAASLCSHAVRFSFSPICLEDLFSSTLPVNFLRCGHAIHVSCLDSLLYQPDQSSPWRCPTCKRSIDRDPTNDAHIESYLLECPMPEEYSAWRAIILCNDCVKQAELSYHFAYHRCPQPQCRSFNTDVISVKRIERGSEEDKRWRREQRERERKEAEERGESGVGSVEQQGRLPSAYERARAAGLDANRALEAGRQQIREEMDSDDEDDEDEEEEEEEMKDGSDSEDEDEDEEDEDDEDDDAEVAEDALAQSDSGLATGAASAENGYVQFHEEPISEGWQDVVNDEAGRMESDERARWEE